VKYNVKKIYIKKESNEFLDLPGVKFLSNFTLQKVWVFTVKQSGHSDSNIPSLMDRFGGIISTKIET